MSLSIDHRNRWARLRFSVIGPLLASPPGKGALQEALQGLAAKVWRHPITGADVRFGASTIERWYSAEQIIQRSRRQQIGKLAVRSRPPLRIKIPLTRLP